MKLVIYPAVEPARLQHLQAAADSMSIANCDSEEAAIREMPDADAFFGKLTPSMLAAANRLRWVQSPTASLEHYVFPELVEHPCVLTNMRGLFSDVIAEHVFGYMLCFTRNLHSYIRQQATRTWSPVGGESERTTFAAGPGTVTAMDRAHGRLSDYTLGIVGFGSIGGEIARRGVLFGMTVFAVDPLPVVPPDGVECVWNLDRLPELLQQSDFVIIAAPHTPESAGMFGREQFRLMKSSAYLINIGRGVLVRLDDLCQALSAGEIAGAALDVFEQEPLPPEHPLWHFDNVILTPHVAACSIHIAERHLAVVTENIQHFLRAEPLKNVVDKRHWF